MEELFTGSARETPWEWARKRRRVFTSPVKDAAIRVSAAVFGGAIAFLVGKQDWQQSLIIGVIPGGLVGWLLSVAEIVYWRVRRTAVLREEELEELRRENEKHQAERDALSNAAKILERGTGDAAEPSMSTVISNLDQKSLLVLRKLTETGLLPRHISNALTRQGFKGDPEPVIQALKDANLAKSDFEGRISLNTDLAAEIQKARGSQRQSDEAHAEAVRDSAKVAPDTLLQRPILQVMGMRAKVQLGQVFEFSFPIKNMGNALATNVVVKTAWWPRRTGEELPIPPDDKLYERGAEHFLAPGSDLNHNYVSKGAPFDADGLLAITSGYTTLYMWGVVNYDGPFGAYTAHFGYFFDTKTGDCFLIKQKGYNETT